jgi:hypothetical protein
MEHKTPKISIIMVDGLFREKFHAVDFFCDQTMPSEDYELLWVEYYHQVDPELQTKIDQYPNARVITLNREGTYHSSYCFNGGITAAKSELLVIPDADVAVERDFLERVWQEHQTNDKLLLYIHRYDEAQTDHLEPITLEHLRRVCVLKNTMNFGGCLAVRKKWLLAINGYEQHPLFEGGFHANGRDVFNRLRHHGLPVMWHPTLKLYHAWHLATGYGRYFWKRQRVVTDYRDRQLHTLPYHGIDPIHDSKFQQILAAQIATYERDNAHLKERDEAIVDVAHTLPGKEHLGTFGKLVKRLFG